jgi:hypothetical protein
LAQTNRLRSPLRGRFVFRTERRFLKSELPVPQLKDNRGERLLRDSDMAPIQQRQITRPQFTDLTKTPISVL